MLVTTSIGLLLIVTASKESADLEKFICNSLHLVSFNSNLSVSACLTSSAKITWLALVDCLGHGCVINILCKVGATDIDVIYHDQGPNLVPCSTPALTDPQSE